MKRTLMMFAAAAALVAVSPADLTAQSKFGKFVKKAAKAVSETSSALSDSSSDSGSSNLTSEGNATSSDTSSDGPAITTPARTLSVVFYDAKAEGNDLYIDFSVMNKGAAMDLYNFTLAPVKDAKGKAYPATYTVSGERAYSGRINIALGADDALYFEMKIVGAADQTVNIEFNCQNVGLDKTHSATGKLLLRGISKTE